ISFTALTILIIVGYVMARSALIPVTAIVKDVEKITASEIYKRLTVVNKDDELGELSIAFNRLLDRLEKAFKSQKMFVSNVSHELRTPMAALVAELELVSLKKRTPQRYEDAVNNALLDAGRIIKLIEGLLDMAKADYAPEQIKMADVRIDELLLDAREMVMKANPEYNIELTFEMEAEDDSVITVFGNSYLLTTAFVNMIDNNCKFSANKASYISISFWQEMSILRFSDNGTGMTESDKNNIFTPFYRGVNKNFAHGHGIGMTLTKKIISLHKGSLDINSYPGEGTTFVVKLPHI
ncbi:MAG: HAMP domain-containing sensor histidine kinase, partial [Bacteroidales bacterium]